MAKNDHIGQYHGIRSLRPEAGLIEYCMTETNIFRFCSEKAADYCFLIFNIKLQSGLNKAKQ